LSAGYENHFSTIGIVGMNECCRNFFKNLKKKDWGIQTDEGAKFSKEVLQYMKKRLSDFQVETGNLYNLEATPAESTSFRLALHDKKKYPDILTSGTVGTPYYTNSTNLPVGYTSDPWVAIQHQQQFQTEYTGGSVLHLFADSNNAPTETVKALIRKALENSDIPYYSYSPSIRVCKKGHGLLTSLDNETCPFCREEIINNYTKKLNELK
jgi:ribonucleoside-triphosphate reductase